MALAEALGVPGSSPLARGLPALNLGKGRIKRIIPARAGFTTARRELLNLPADHPRSRGVYAVQPAREVVD